MQGYAEYHWEGHSCIPIALYLRYYVYRIAGNFRDKIFDDYLFPTFRE